MKSERRKRKKPTIGLVKPSPSKNQKHFVTAVKTNDVLLGRGATVLKNEGNIRFRQLILANKVEYNSTRKHALKDQVAGRILKTIINDRGGKFLRKIDNPQEQIGITNNGTKEVWLVEGEEVCLLKVKQALREHDSSSSSSPKRPHNTERGVAICKQRRRKKVHVQQSDSSSDNLLMYKLLHDNESESSSSGNIFKNNNLVLHHQRQVVGSNKSKKQNYSQNNKAESATPIVNSVITENVLHSVNQNQCNDKVAEYIPNNDSSIMAVCNTVKSLPADSSNISDISRLQEESQEQHVIPIQANNNSSSYYNDSKNDYIEMSSFTNNLSFRLKHPSLRKRDLSRLRRRQQQQQQQQTSDSVSSIVEL